MAAIAATRASSRLGVAQMLSVADAEANLATVGRLVRKAAAGGCTFLCLPEAFDIVGTPGTGESSRAAQPLDGPLFQRYQALARESNIWLSLGGFHERVAGEGKIANTHCIVDGRGALVASYRKVHLFDVDVDGGFKEHARRRLLFSCAPTNPLL